MAGSVLEVHVGHSVFDEVEQAFDYVTETLASAVGAATVPVSEAMRYALQRVADSVASKMTPWHGDMFNGTPYLQTRSNAGIVSIRQSIKVTGGTMATLAGQISAAKLSVHETGATITPKASKYLTIPFPSALDSSGVPLRKRARDWDNTFVRRSKRGNLIIFRKALRGEITPLYLLKTSVKIPPRLGMEDAFLNQGVPYFQQKALDAIEAAIDKAFAQ